MTDFTEDQTKIIDKLIGHAIQDFSAKLAVFLVHNVPNTFGSPDEFTAVHHANVITWYEQHLHHEEQNRKILRAKYLLETSGYKVVEDDSKQHTGD